MDLILYIEVIYHRHPCRNNEHDKKTDCLNEKIHYVTETLTLKVTSTTGLQPTVLLEVKLQLVCCRISARKQDRAFHFWLRQGVAISVCLCVCPAGDKLSRRTDDRHRRILKYFVLFNIEYIYCH